MLLKIESFVEKYIAPSLKSHGGKIEVIDFDNNTLFIKLSGACQGCAAASITLTKGVETQLKQEFPEIEKIVDLTNHKEGKNPYY